MATLAEIDRQHRKRHAPPFKRAADEVRRMSAAIALDTIHGRRLCGLRAALIHKMRCNDTTMLSAWLGEFGVAVDMECRAAHRSVAQGSLAA